MGRRTRIPTQKAQEAAATMEVDKTSAQQQPRQSPRTQKLIAEESIHGPLKHTQPTDLVPIAGSPRGMLMGDVNSKSSWENEVERVHIAQKKASVWDNFDTTKMNNAGFKLEFVEPAKYGESSICAIVLEDISTEIEFWQNSVRYGHDAEVCRRRRNTTLKKQVQSVEHVENNIQTIKGMGMKHGEDKTAGDLKATKGRQMETKVTKVRHKDGEDTE
ncbi:hypothetical protein HAX54_029335 [Datura stramonium]|uniref:Uncharacterized protein n=1 Tax=Datura stramonium TaxID=4076 RepID=A0ABS8V810_DATST|nr:hypothetical protein [Datura stramonium]